jgi:amino acid adenylation domain-containing protein
MWDSLAKENSANLMTGMTNESLAYVIFTSGSTGTPKGAMNTHRGICNRLIWMQDTYGLTAEDRILQKTPVSFDVSVWEFFWPLITGAQLIVAKPGGHQDTGYLVKLIADQRITTLHFVPAQLQIVLDEPEIDRCDRLCRVFCSGEELPVALEIRFFSHLNAELHNLYGPTEAAVDVTAWVCHPKNNHSTVPIGKPIANTSIYLLDSQQRPVPIGVPGEIYIGGCQLARGYLNRSDLTAEKFLPHPFSETLGARLYRTGDLARFRPDGVIEFVGRKDHQVKIRGCRIELGEIEAVLEQFPEVKEAVVLCREDKPGEKNLTAYVVPIPSAQLTTEALHRAMNTQFPKYMCPSSISILNALPLTPNGKIDRLNLPPPNRENKGFEISKGYSGNLVNARPQNSFEIQLAEIWKEILGVEHVGVYDNFFDLGGHSLLSMKVVIGIEKKLGLRINPEELMAQTLGQLASLCEELLESRESRSFLSHMRQFGSLCCPQFFKQYLKKSFPKIPCSKQP